MMKIILICFFLVSTFISAITTLEEEENHENIRVFVSNKHSKSRSNENSEYKDNDSEINEPKYSRYPFQKDSTNRRFEIQHYPDTNEENKKLPRNKAIFIESRKLNDRSSGTAQSEQKIYRENEKENSKSGYSKYKLERKEPKKQQISVKVLKEQTKTILADRADLPKYINREVNHEESNHQENSEAPVKNYEVKEVRPREKNIFVNVLKEDKQTYLLKEQTEDDSKQNKNKYYRELGYKTLERDNSEDKPSYKNIKYREEKTFYENKPIATRKGKYFISNDGSYNKKDFRNNKRIVVEDSKQIEKNDNDRPEYKITETTYRYIRNDDKEEQENSNENYNTKTRKSENEEIFVNLNKDNEKSLPSDHEEHSHLDEDHNQNEDVIKVSRKSYNNKEDSYVEYEKTNDSPENKQEFILVKENEKKTESQNSKNVIAKDKFEKYTPEYVKTDFSLKQTYSHEIDSERDEERKFLKYATDKKEETNYEFDDKPFKAENKNDKEKAIFVKVVKPKTHENTNHDGPNQDVVVKIWTRKSK